MAKITFAWPLLCTIVTAFSSVFAQTPIVQYFPGSGGLNSVWQLSQGGYMAVGSGVDTSFMLYRINGQGDILWGKWYRIYDISPMSMTHRLSVRAAAASDGGCFILCYTRKQNPYPSYSVLFNSVMKTSAQGDSIWSVIISSTDAWASANFQDLVATPVDGGCVAVGAGSFGEGPQIVKISSAGTVSWETVIPAMTSGTFRSVCLSSDGGYIATGLNSSSYLGLDNLLVAKFNSAGTTVWSKTFYSGHFDIGDRKHAEGYSVAATPDGGCMLSGYVSDPGMYGGPALLMRLNASGDSLWTKTYFRWPDLNPFQEATAYGLVQLPSGQYLMYLKQYAGSTNAQATLVKLNTSGDSLWSQIGYDYKMMMTGIDQEGGVLLVGYYPPTFIRTTAGGLYISPRLASPSDHSINVALRPNLAWSGGSQLVSSFCVQVARDSLFTNVVFDTSNVTSEAVQTSQLPSSTRHFWRVQSFGKEGGPTQWSDVWRFTTQAGTSVEKTAGDVPTSFSLEQNYPNPFNPSTMIQYDLPVVAHVTLVVYNMLGQVAAKLVDEEQNAGTYRARWDGSGAASGMYFYRLVANAIPSGQAGSLTETKKLLLLR